MLLKGTAINKRWQRWEKASSEQVSLHLEHREDAIYEKNKRGRSQERSRLEREMRSGVILSAAVLAFFSIFLSLKSDTGPRLLSSAGAATMAGQTPERRARDVLHSAELLRFNGTFGPESFAFDAEGRGPYTGVADGRILRWGGATRGWEDFATVSPYW